MTHSEVADHYNLRTDDLFTRVIVAALYWRARAEYWKAKYHNRSHTMPSSDMPFTTLQVTFPESSRPYTYKVPLSLLEELTPASKAVVNTRGKFIVVDILGVDDEARLDPGSDYKWIVDLVNIDNWEEFSQ